MNKGMDTDEKRVDHDGWRPAYSPEVDSRLAASNSAR
jgi:hypothetical protein